MTITIDELSGHPLPLAAGEKPATEATSARRATRFGQEQGLPWIGDTPKRGRPKDPHAYLRAPLPPPDPDPDLTAFVSKSPARSSYGAVISAGRNHG